MRRIALSAVVAATLVVVTTSVVRAEPVMLTALQMDVVTAGLSIVVDVPTSVVTGDVLVQSNITTQVANAIANAIATCGVCIGAAPDVASLAQAINTNATQLIQR